MQFYSLAIGWLTVLPCGGREGGKFLAREIEQFLGVRDVARDFGDAAVVRVALQANFRPALAAFTPHQDDGGEGIDYLIAENESGAVDGIEGSGDGVVPCDGRWKCSTQGFPLHFDERFRGVDDVVSDSREEAFPDVEGFEDFLGEVAVSCADFDDVAESGVADGVGDSFG